ncbi:electrogenic sodium bicarbonate cotransporter 1-like [Ruditapes philippinarum]|uniref:electrogenic sodium bicarbonate cotransporter 1-like n=1 Tax=Ruditapes philippinarum TaxID=129788 RepID=UPI00295AACC9|nr:electrogenic sodium bicarbonate cotransporter 1-like [Ruditapes philippinarum]XP_060568439.1 electrogenic sodium bicarbonate cotransporter 1-like [Ruditapes philippinarum]
MMTTLDDTADITSNDDDDQSNLFNEYFTAAEHATERVASLVNGDFESSQLFVQMDVLREYKGDLVWQEMARWIRYEEAVEEGGQRWSKPHVASLMMEALQDLQNILSTCPVILDSKARTMADVADDIINAWLLERPILEYMKDKLSSILMKLHKFQYVTKSRDMKSNNLSSVSLSRKLQEERHVNGAYKGDCDSLSKSSSQEFQSLSLGEMNKNFMRHIPAGAQAVNILVGEVSDLDKVTAAFVRLQDACNLGNITEVNLDSKFMFVMLCPRQYLGHCIEMCRCMGALFSDEIFRCVGYRCEDRFDLLCGIQEFSVHLTVLPPGVWDSSTRIEPPDQLPPQDYRKNPGQISASKLSIQDKDKVTRDDHQENNPDDLTLLRTGRLFGGLIQDIKRKVPHYLSDFKDALHIQCVASFFFLFLVTLTPNVTFGGLLGHATDNHMGTMECILAAAISGVVFALCAGQPLNILGSTGPMLVLEGILYTLCKDLEWDFLPFRVWVGFWTGLFILIIVALDLSALVRYITRFTEESFACLIALIFIYEAFKKTYEIESEAPVQFSPRSNDVDCLCIIYNSSNSNQLAESLKHARTGLTSMNVSTSLNSSTGLESAAETQCSKLSGTITGETCQDNYVPDVFFFSVILFLGTYFLATILVNFRHSLFFPTFVRQNVSDFAVLISIVAMVTLDAVCDLPTPKLHVPEEFKPTKPGRPWFINPISDKNPWWLIPLSSLPALLATILIFMDQQITAVIVNRSENKLKKGCGYHLDMLVVGILVVILALLGLPWYVAATVTALAHVMSLKKVSECTAPGEKPTFLGVREQRVTSLLVAIFSGLAVLFTSVLKHVPMPVLYGVFLYMGVAPLANMQLIQRVLIIFMPTKYQPDYPYIRNVPIKRVHLFTLIEVICLAVLWVVKSVKVISIGFPLMVLIICFIRKALDKVFTQRELNWLDDILPSAKGSQIVLFDIKVDEEEKETEETQKDLITSNNVHTMIGISNDSKDRDRRASSTFICKTDIDKLKATAPLAVANRRQSLAMAAKRRQSTGVIDHMETFRKFSTPLMYTRRLSTDLSHFHNGGLGLERQQRTNRLMSLPSTMVDVTETDQEYLYTDPDTECPPTITKF